MERDTLWLQLNFGATIWIFLGCIAVLMAVFSNAPIEWFFVYYVFIIVLSIKLILIFITDELFSLQYLVK
jgi:hypothetical protein